METINGCLNAIVQWTLLGVTTGFCLLCVLSIWKWFIGVVKRALLYLFPGLGRKRGEHDDESGDL